MFCAGFRRRGLTGFSTVQVVHRALDIIVAAIPVGTLIAMAYLTVVDTGMDCLQCNRQHLRACCLPQVNILSFKTATVSMTDCRAKCRSRPYAVFWVAGAPTVVICALGACTQKLRSKGIDFLNPSKLKIAADVSIVCFDKTGTLTGSVVREASLQGHCLC